MKRVLMFIIVIILLSGCTVEEKDVPEYWDEIEGKEYVNFDVFAGQGIYFFTVDDTPHCKYMKYGSGVPVIYEFESEVLFDGEKMIIQMPENVLGPWEEIPEMVNHILNYEDGNIIWDDLVYVESEITCHDGC